MRGRDVASYVSTVANAGCSISQVLSFRKTGRG
jgi:hypothetical protein